jgi:carbon-monoxide dehydrogenase medium subunit
MADFADEAKLLAGGQSLVPMMSAGFLRPEVLVDLNGVSGLSHVSLEDGEVRVGALVRHAQLERADAAIARSFPMFGSAAPLISHPPVRNRGTLIGSVVHADPSAEWPAVVLAAGGQVVLVSRSGERTVSAAEFFTGPLSSDVSPEEIAVEVRLPAARPRSGAAVRELTYRHGDYAVVGVACQATLREDGGVEDCRIGLFGVDAVPVRALEAEAVMRTGGSVEDAALVAANAAHPSSDATASATYRKEMIPVYCRRALNAALETARRGEGTPPHVQGRR